MAKMSDAAIVRHIDRTGTKVKAFRDGSDNFVQAVAVVNEEGEITTQDDGMVVKPDQDDWAVVFNRIEAELKIMNLHLSSITGIEINKEDIG